MCKNSPFLQLSDTYLLDSLCSIVTDFLDKFRHFETINLGYNQITTKGLSLLVKKMKTCKHLKEINLDFNQLGGSQ